MSSNLTPLEAGVVFKENLALGYGTQTDDCAIDWTEIGIHTFTREVNVLDFGADRTGIADSTAAFYAAMAALTYGGRIIVPEGLYSVNLVITGRNFHFVGQCQSYEQPLSQVGLAPFDGALPTIQYGDGTTTTQNIRFSNFHIRPKTAQTGVIGVKFIGCNRCYLDHCSILGHSQKAIHLTSSATLPTYHIHLSRLNIATLSGTAGSLGIDYDYGSQYVTVVCLSESDINGNSGASYVLDLEANCTIFMSNVWFEAGNNRGWHFQATSSIVRGSGVAIDSSSSNDVLINSDADTVVTAIVMGDVTIDGKATFPSGTTETLGARHFIPYQSLLLYPEIQGQLNFTDTAAVNANQHTRDTINKIFRSGTTLILQSETGNIQFRVPTGSLVDLFSGSLQIREVAVAGGSSNLVLGRGTQTTVGAAGAASALPATPTGYLRFFLGSTEYVIPYYAKA